MISGMWILRFCLFLVACCSALPQEFDVAIVNGRVMDPGSGLDAIRSVGVRGGRIAAEGSWDDRDVIADAAGVDVLAHHS